MIARVYVDGLSLFYGSLKGTPYKWLNIEELCMEAFPELSIRRIKYFTAKVLAPPYDPSKRRRQLYYLRALKTLRIFEPKYGRFYSHYVELPKAESWRRGILERVEVLKSEEKQTDVNLASHMINDAWSFDFEVAVFRNGLDQAQFFHLVNIFIKNKDGIRATFQCCGNRVSVPFSSIQPKFLHDHHPQTSVDYI